MLHDTHCHLGHCEADVEEILAAAALSGVVDVVDVGMGLAESAVVVERAEASGGRIRAAVGIHPNDLDDFLADPKACMEQLAKLASSPSVVAIGETGLDYYRTRATPDDQRRAFEAHIQLARDTDLTLVIHCRDAHADVLEVLDAAGSPDRVIMHCFSGDMAFAHECVSRGYWCSFAGNLTYKKNQELRDAAKVIPMNRLLVETDSPYLSPLPYRGKPNSPANVALTADCLAETLGVEVASLASTLHENTVAAFRLG